MSSDYREGYKVGFKDGKAAGKKEIIDMFNNAKLGPQPLMIADPVPTIRDQFAMAALATLSNKKYEHGHKLSIAEMKARDAYEIADAMLEERNKRG